MEARRVAFAAVAAFGLGFAARADVTVSDVTALRTALEGDDPVIRLADGVYEFDTTLTLSGKTVIGNAANREAVVLRNTGTTRCLYLKDNAVLSSVKLTATATKSAPITETGAGAYVETGVITNCVITGLWSNQPATALELATSKNIKICDCEIVNNNTTSTHNNSNQGLGTIRCAASNYISHDPEIYRTKIANNSTGASGSYGAGVVGCTLYDCAILNNRFPSGNSAGKSYGGGCYQSKLYRCVVSGNYALSQGGGLHNCEAYDCLIAENTTRTPYTYKNVWGNGSGVAKGKYYNCTIVANKTTNSSTKGTESGVWSAELYNCIVRESRIHDDTENNLDGCSTVKNTCYAEADDNDANGNINQDPLLTADYKLAKNSPCVNAGDKTLYAVGDFDLTGVNPRVIGANIDMGCYELPFGMPLILVVR